MSAESSDNLPHAVGEVLQQKPDDFRRVLEAAGSGSAHELIEALIAYGTLSPEARDAP